MFYSSIYAILYYITSAFIFIQSLDPQCNRHIENRTDAVYHICDAACVLQTHEDSYSLATEHGRLYGWYSRTSVTPSSVNFLAMDDIPDGEPVSLREVVHRAAGGSGQGMLKCSCKLMCRGRCRCVTAGSLFRYHKSRKCNNKYKKAFVYMDVGKELIFGRQLISVLI